MMPCRAFSIGHSTRDWELILAKQNARLPYMIAPLLCLSATRLDMANPVDVFHMRRTVTSSLELQPHHGLAVVLISWPFDCATLKPPSRALCLRKAPCPSISAPWRQIIRNESYRDPTRTNLGIVRPGELASSKLLQPVALA